MAGISAWVFSLNLEAAMSFHLHLFGAGIMLGEIVRVDIECKLGGTGAGDGRQVDAICRGRMVLMTSE